MRDKLREWARKNYPCNCEIVPGMCGPEHSGYLCDGYDLSAIVNRLMRLEMTHET